MRPEGAMHLLVIEHGASTNMRHATLAAISKSLAEQGIATFRYNFPYSAKGGGRMTSTAQSEQSLDGVKGLVFFSFPLHLPGRPDTKRAEHLKQIDIPMRFLSGTRDALAEIDLPKPVVKNVGEQAKLHLLDTADHSYKILKKTRTSDEDVFVEMARVTRILLEKRS